jgi:GAF domain-containing protein/anti-sigma regulatory factor (Ser/Thr protein kinase)
MNPIESLRRVAELARSVSSALDREEVFSQVAAALTELRRDAVCAIRLVDPEAGGYRLAVSAGAAVEQRIPVVPFGEGLTDVVATTRRPLLVTNNRTDPRAVRGHWSAERRMTVYFGVPIEAAGDLFGVLNVNFPAALPPTDAERSMIEVLAGHAAVAIRNARLFAEATQRRREAEELARFARTLAEELDVASAADVVLTTVLPLLRVDSSILRLRESDGSLVAVARSGAARAQFPPGHVLPSGVGIVGRAVTEGVAQTRNVTDEKDTALTDDLRERLFDAGLQTILAVPLRLKGEVLGVLAVGTALPRTFDAAEIALLQTFADQASVALANARLFAESERRRQVAERLADISRLVSQSLETHEVAQRIVDGLPVLFEARTAGLYRLDATSDDLVSVAIAGDVGEQAGETIVFPRGTSAIGFAVAQGHPVVSPDVLSDPRLTLTDDVRARIERSAYRSTLALPLVARGRVIGALAVGDRAGRVFDAEAIATGQAFADQAALALENARLYQESLEQRRRLATLVELTRRLTRGLDVDSLLGSIAEAAALLFGGDAGFRLIEGDSLVRVAATEGALGAMTRERIRLGETFSGQVAVTGEAVVSEDTSTDPRRIPEHQAALAPGRAGALMCVPIRLGDRILGTLNIYRERGFRFDDEALRLATSFADQAAIAIENARLYQAVKQAYEELSRTQEQLVRGKTLRALGVLAAGAAHHLNNLLAIIVGRVQLLLARERTPAEIARALGIINRAAENSADVVRRLAAFGRGQAASSPEPVNLNDIARNVLELTRPRWRDEPQLHSIAIEAVLEPGTIPLIAAEVAPLQEALVNLVVNAVEAMPNGGRLLIRTWASASGVHCSVSDTGVGMSPEVQAKALEPFFTTKGVKSTGLGLSFSHGVIQGHGGELTIESRTGKGTTVAFRLPAAGHDDRAERSGTPTTRVARLRILVIDDDEDVRAAVTELLEELGHTVVQAAGGQEALEWLAAHGDVQLVITDLGMPGLNGWAVARAIKDRAPRLPVVLLTGWGVAVGAMATERAAVDAVIAKPVTDETLKATIAAVTSAY